MSFDFDDEILQDFLVEAGEILEQLSEQLVELEQRPNDMDLLNAVFRGFHTVKGGAGFINASALVEVCHRAEDVFNTLRQGQREVDAGLMDVVLRVVDIVNAMMDDVRNGAALTPADPALLERLLTLVQPQTAQSAEVKTASSPDRPAATDAADEALDAMIEDLSAKQAVPDLSKSALPGSSEDITEEEFDALLDQLHGQGKSIETPVQASPSGRPHVDDKAGPTATAHAAPSDSTSSDEITEEEFEALLDELHGGGKIGPAASGPSMRQKTETSSNGPVNAVTSPAALSVIADKAENNRAVLKDGQATAPTPAQADTTVRVDTRRLDDIMNLVGELVLVRNRMATLKASIQDEEIAQVVSNLDLVTSDLQTAVMKTRMQPIKKVFSRFPRVVRDLSRSLDKEITLEMYGEDTDLDKNLVEALADPLVHLVRNAIDHGIEMPSARVAAGKPRTGTIVLSAKQEGDHISITIQDDGAGMDAEKLRTKVIEKELLDADAAARLSDQECFNLIFLPGFSTKSDISDISGRGVGMDVVKTRIAQLNGMVEINSELGVGSEIYIKLPLTLAIVPTLMVMLGNQTFAVPLSNVSEIINMEAIRTNVVDGQPVAIVREHPLPLYFLRDWLVRNAHGTARPEGGYLVVVRVGSQHLACVVDQLIAQEEVVIKPLGALLHGTPGLAGATITGDGRIALILDMPGLMLGYAKQS